MSAASAWVLAGGLWVGCLVPGPWWLAPAGLALLLAGRLAGGGEDQLAAGGSGGHPRAAGGGDHPDRNGGRRRRVGLLVATLAVALVGAGLTGGREALRDGGALSALAAAGGAAELRATVVTEARPMADGAWLLVRVTRVDDRATRERALLRVVDLAEAPAMGERLALVATARPLAREGFDAHLRRLHAAVAIDPSVRENVGGPGRVLGATNRVRGRTRAAFSRHLAPDQAGLLAGLTIGDTHGRSPERAAQFAAASLTHLVVVSGRHVALMLAGVLGLAAALGVGARGRRVLGLGAVGWYAVLVRWQPSVLRAGVMAGLVLAAGLLGRGRDSRHVLAMAVLLLLLADPMLAGQLGFVLSVTATAGVLVAAPWLAERLPGPRPVCLVMAVTLGAQIGAAPALLAWLDGVPATSVPANLVAVPAAGVAQTVGLVAGMVAQVSVGAGAAVAVLATPALAVVLWAAETFSTGPVLRPEHLLSPTALLVVTGVLAGAMRRRAVAAAALAAVLGLAVWPAVRPPIPVRAFTVTAFDVGQGDALLVEVPGDPPARMLYDGGPEPGAALAHLRRRGVRRLDAVVASHPHDDHVAGLPAVLSTLDVGAFLVGPVPPEAHGEHLAPSSRAGYTAAEAAGVPVVAVHDGRRFSLGTATVEVLSPPADGSLGLDHNANSVVLRVSTPAGRLLLTGDAEQTAQQRLLHTPQRLRADVVQVPHHGGDTNADGFLAAAGAHTAVISVGENDYGHPRPAVLADLAGARVHRTDRDGTVTVEVRAVTPGGSTTLPGDGRPSPDVPADRPGGAAPAPGRRPHPRRAACAGRRPRRDRPACRRPRRCRPARPAHRLAVRHAPRGAPARRAGSAGGCVRGAGRRARRCPARGDGDPARVGHRADHEARQAGQGLGRASGHRPAAGLEDRGVAAAGRRGVPPAWAHG